jgi:hypothetical protein
VDPQPLAERLRRDRRERHDGADLEYDLKTGALTVVAVQQEKRADGITYKREGGQLLPIKIPGT